MKITLYIFLLTLIPLAAISQKKKTNQPYFPEPNNWLTRTPAEAGLNAAKLAEAIAFAKERESKTPRDLIQAHYQSAFGREPFGEAVGPFAERGPATGIIIRNGYIVATWGEPLRVDMTFSVTKSFLSSTIGLAYDRGLIKSIDDTVAKAIAPIQIYTQPVTNKADHIDEPSLIKLFDTPHNRTITWNHLLRQTSDWEGSLWGKPEWADRPGDKPAEWRTRPRNAPGKVYEYNDVRVNVLALAALNIWRQPLPQVLRENIMDPIGASPTWRWFGYENSWIVLDGQIVQAVGGGGHWGGGMFINAHDLARFGYLTLNRGRWKDKQILSEQWVSWALTPTPAQPTYGFMNWFLNTDRKYLPSAPATAFAHIGNGTNMVYVDPENNLVVVARWIENGALNDFISRVLAAIEK